MHTIGWLRVALLLVAGMLAAPAPARAETQVCTVIASLPIYINTEGHYCLEQDFDYTGVATAALQIDADNAVLDCNHHRITQVGHPGQSTGLYVTNEREGVILRNCTMEDFSYPIFVQSSSEPGAHADVIEGNTVLRSGAVGIQAIGSNLRIERNRVSGNTGVTNGTAVGIFLLNMGTDGTSNTIRDNVITDFKPAAPPVGSHTTVMGIAFSNVDDTEVTGNVVSGLYATTGSWVEGIESQGTNNSIIARNTVLAAPPLPAPLDGAQSYGIVLYGPNVGNVCRDNTVGHFTSLNLSGCLDSVNTDF
jgi:hypothetical protein